MKKRRFKYTAITEVVILLGLSVLPRISEAQSMGAPLRATTPEPDAPITSGRQQALRLFRAITGITVGIDDARLKQMEPLIATGKAREAAKIATADPAFYDVRLQQMAAKMSGREETIQEDLNDFTATFVGAVRDGLDARQLLTGNFIYRADVTKVSSLGYLAPADDTKSLVYSNDHYGDFQSQNLSLYTFLTRQNAQYVESSAVVVVLPDPAGLITTRAFLSSHAEGGTNRRLVNYAFREFMCVEMSEWRDATRPDDFVGRDVDRFPGGSNPLYQTSCRGCHAQLDAFRGAFAQVNFYSNSAGYGANVSRKFASNADIYPEGYVTTNDTFANYATGAVNMDRFGWRSATTGKGMNAFGTMLANSKGFSRCMTKRFYSAICRRAPTTQEEASIRLMADQFETTYRLKDLAEIVAIHPSCLADR